MLTVCLRNKISDPNSLEKARALKISRGTVSEVDSFYNNVNSEPVEVFNHDEKFSGDSGRCQTSNSHEGLAGYFEMGSIPRIPLVKKILPSPLSKRARRF